MIAFLSQSSGGQSASPFSFLIFLVPIALLFYFMNRGQRRRQGAQRMLLNSLEVGDEVMTSGGILGKIIEIDDDEGIIEVEIAPGTKVKMVKSGIMRKLVEDDGSDDEDDDDEHEGPWFGDEDQGHEDGDDDHHEGAGSPS